MSTQRTRIATITDSVTALGMKLAGMGEVADIDDEHAAAELITQFANDPTIAVMIITERIGEANRDLLFRISQRPWPVVVEIPGPEGKIERESSTLKELVRQALGIEIEI